MRRLAAAAALLIAGAAFAQSNPNNSRGFDPEKVYQVGDVDHVNVFNGNLIVTIPIGQTYKVSDHLSWRLSLVYNGNPWNYRTTGVTEAIPNRFANAGLGWQLSLGELVAPKDPLAASLNATTWIYAAPDGAERSFHRTLHEEEKGTTYEAPAAPGTWDVVGYTNDSSYLRLVRVGAYIDGTTSQGNLYKFRYRVEFPDGTAHTFESREAVLSQTPPAYEYEQAAYYRLTRMEDRFGNSVTVNYSGTQWTIQENAAGASSPIRTHTVTLGEATFLQFGDSAQWRPRVESVQLAAFGGKTLKYTFEYDQKTIGLPCAGTDSTRAQTTTMTLLRSVYAADAASGTPLLRYTMKHTELDPSGQCSATAGHLTRLDLPTGGWIEYEASLRRFPTATDGTVKDREANPSEISFAVSKRTLVESANVRSETSYRSELHSPTDPTVLPGQLRNRQMTVAVQDAANNVTYHHFMVWRDTAAPNNCLGGYDTREYGMPYLRTSNTSQGGLFLSTEVFDGSCTWSTAGDCGLPACIGSNGSPKTPIRRGYVGYDFDTFDSNRSGYNSRMRGTRTMYPAECATCYSQTEHTGFDGLGHYRTETKSSGSSSTSRVTMTAYNANANRGTYPGSAVNQYMIARGDEWLLNLHDEVRVSEGSTIVEQLCVDRSTGFVKQRRRLAGTARSAKDLVTVYQESGGNVIGETFYGGDGAPSSFPTGGLCATDNELGTPEYQLEHIYAYGSRTTSTFLSNGVSMPFKSLDLTIDRNTGLAAESRDTAGVVTKYSYDVLGRVASVEPAGTAKTSYAYSMSPPSVSAISSSSGSILKDQRFYYDGLGRLIQTREQLPPDGQTQAWAASSITYDILGRKITASTPEKKTEGTYGSYTTGHKTTYAYDVLGRTTTITAPDGAATSFSYLGDWQKTITRSIFTGTTETSVPTVEHYDHLGRLIKVVEKSGPTSPASPIGADVATQYTYHAGGQLATVNMADTQFRTFTYDGRGFLQSEKHPESGTTQYSYDSRGHVTKKVAADNKVLAFTYDKAERLFTVTEDGQDLKTFRYDRPNSGTDYSLGKLDYAERHNRLPDLGRDEIVRETYVYAGPGGRLSSKKTRVGAYEFSDGYTYDVLGDVASVKYPDCTGCGSLSAPSRTIQNTYSFGLLTAVNGYAELGYAPNGMVTKVQHSGGKTGLNPLYEVTPDASGMPRPNTITVSNFCEGLAVTKEPQDAAIQSGQAVTFSVTVSGATSYQWYQGETAIAGATSASYTATPGATTSYWVRAGNGSCTVDSRAAQVTVLCSAEGLAIQAGASVQAGAQAEASIENLAGNSYLWSITGGTIISGGNTAVVTYRAGCSGTVMLTATVNAACGTSTLSRSVEVASFSATVSGSKEIQYGGSATIQVSLPGTGPWTVKWSDGHEQSNVSGSSATRSVSPEGTTTYTATVTNSGGCQVAASGSATVTVIPPAPGAVNAEATATDAVRITWAFSAPSPDSFEIAWQTRDAAGTFTVSGTVRMVMHTGRSANTAYLYSVRAIRNGTQSPASASDLATTTIFTDSGLVRGSNISAHHMQQLRTAVDAVRHLAVLSPYVYSESIAAGNGIKRTHIEELRTALAEARQRLPLPAIGFTFIDPNKPRVKAVHVTELRAGTQ